MMSETATTLDAGSEKWATETQREIELRGATAAIWLSLLLFFQSFQMFNEQFTQFISF